MTGLVAPAVSGGLPQSAGMPSVDHLICNVNEHHHLVCHLFVVMVDHDCVQWLC